MTTPTSITIEGRHGIHVFGRADLVTAHGPEDGLTDWVEPHLPFVDRWDMGWLVGRYVHAEHANENGHIFPLDDLVTAYQLVPHTALDMLHRQHHVIGAYVAAEMLWPKGKKKKLVMPATAAIGEGSDPATPWVETLASVWRVRFPDEYAAIQQAHAMGVLCQSMECMPRSVTCATCDTEFPYKGPVSETYNCGHLATQMNDARRRAPKRLNKPHFTGGGVVLPPARPGWRDASIRQVAAMAEVDPVGAGELLQEVAAQLPELDGKRWEEMMGALLIRAGADIPPAPPVTATTLRRSAEGDALEKAQVNLRPSAHSLASCATCTHRENDGCVLVAADDAEDATCDRWTPVQLTAKPALDAAANRNGAMVAFYPPADLAAQLAEFGDEPVEDLHVTLLYLGTAAELGYDLADAVRLVETVAAISHPFQARVQGLGKFRLPDGTEATVGLVDAPGIGDIRERLFNLFDVAGYDPPNDHSYTPHLTLSYSAAGAGPTDMPPEVSWTVEKVCVVWAGELVEVPLGTTGTAPFTHDPDAVPAPA